MKLRDGNELEWMRKETHRLYHIRRTLLELLRDRGYAVLESKDDLQMSKEELGELLKQANFNRDCLTTLKQRHNDNKDRIYAFFPGNDLGKKVGVQGIKELAIRMERHEVQRALVISDGFTGAALQLVSVVNQSKKLTIELFLENELLTNISQQVLGHKPTILSADEEREVLAQYRIKKSELPRIQKSDMIARYYGLVEGQVMKIMRHSETAGRYASYRLCT